MRPFLLVLLLVPRLGLAETEASTTNAPAETSPKAKSVSPGKSRTAQTNAQLQAALDQIAQNNRDLLDLLKKQQAVLEDMQFDRRLQSRQIQSLEERLTETMQENTRLQNKVATLETQVAVRPAPGTGSTPPVPPANMAPPTENAPPATNAPPISSGPASATAPQSYLPPAGSDGPPGTKAWHRLFVLKGDDARKTDLFTIQGRVWRVLWHNQDKPGKTFANTSGLFINAFPKDDTIPQRVCGKVGTGSDIVDLQGPGNYNLQIDASGGSWELAVEDFR